MLALWSAFQARLHTQSTPSGYNSSQSAVSGVWLFANIWFANTMRARIPSLNLPVVTYSIMVNIACTYSPIMQSYATVSGFIRQLYLAMLTAFAISTVISLLVFPITSRKVSHAQMTGMLALLRGVVKQEKLYLQSLEKEDMFAVPADISAAIKDTRAETPDTATDEDENAAASGPRDSVSKKDNGNGGKKKKGKADKKPKHVSAAEAEMVSQTLFKIRDLAGKIQVDLAFARRDIAWGKLNGRQLKQVTQRLQAVVVPVIGISTVIDIFQRLAERRGWMVGEDDGNTNRPRSARSQSERDEEKRVWNEVMKRLHNPFEALSEAIDQGLAHAGLRLEMVPPGAGKKKKGDKGKDASADVEAKGDIVEPGDAAFAGTLRSRLEAFNDVRDDILRTWAKERGLMSVDSNSGSERTAQMEFPQDEDQRHRDQSQLYILLYIESLMRAAGEAVLDLVLYADERVQDGTMTSNRLIYPSNKTVSKWMSSALNRSDGTQENNADPLERFGATANVVYNGSGAFSALNPEHLPATNIWQRLGNGLRAISSFLASEESAFGFRAASATLTIGVVAFLENTYIFFQQQRLVWAMIMVALGMTQSRSFARRRTRFWVSCSLC